MNSTGIASAPAIEFDELLENLGITWYDATKEHLSPSDVLYGLLDHGLFNEKIPPCFSSAGLTQIVLETMGSLLDEPDESTLKKEIGKCAHDYVRYEALRDSNIPRHLGIPHPQAYAAQALAISKHWETIAIHCNKPDPAFSRIYVRHVGDGKIFEMNYKGDERFQFEEDELRWMSGAQFVVAADIATCFPSIYTHSIPWALHGKETAKGSDGLIDFAGNLLDRCTQNTRDRQTNGLLIGPHASTIISEIILTQIDADLQKKGYREVKRHVDDYRFYAANFDEAQRFIKDLGLGLRAFEMSLNEKKTKILPLPRPSDEDWVLVLNRFQFPNDELKFSEIRSYLDLALTCGQTLGKSTPLNYAIKVLAKTQAKNNPGDPDGIATRNLSLRAKRMYTQEAMNLALAYPYLVPLLDEHVFSPYWHDGTLKKIAEFSRELIRIGLHKLYPDTIAHALFLVLKHNLVLDLDDKELINVIALDDCVANVLLLEYALLRDREKIAKAVKKRANVLLKLDAREKDKHWLLIYQIWSESELVGNGYGTRCPHSREQTVHRDR
ncbi:antiviral reverse transcriptase Drt4 [Pararobbsia alpina]|uniref:Reverse transcriptase domain-containing protein n=1 Tax=Pararobbsia alpina TaxID=621374 RepID=A0A6S7BPC9_9BURK|nr:antiviral reverse transcriptase Drt4 [Pararobbsia alpina]CAB3795124.1 hypothetical protein LMG28138_03823 [Pararobbsia alpina]